MNSNHQLKKKARAIRKNLLEQFNKLQTEGQAPLELKKSVFDTLDTIQLAAEMQDVLSLKFPASPTRPAGVFDQISGDTGDLNQITPPIKL